MATQDPIELEALSTGYRVGRNCLNPWERAILDSGGELLSLFASDDDKRAWASRHGIDGDYQAAYLRAVRSQRAGMQKSFTRRAGRTGIR